MIEPGTRVQLSRRKSVVKWARGKEAIVMRQSVEGIFDPLATRLSSRIRYDPIKGSWAVAVLVPGLRGGYAFTDVKDRDMKVIDEEPTMCHRVTQI